MIVQKAMLRFFKWFSLDRLDYFIKVINSQPNIDLRVLFHQAFFISFDITPHSNGFLSLFFKINGFFKSIACFLFGGFNEPAGVENHDIGLSGVANKCISCFF